MPVDKKEDKTVALPKPETPNAIMSLFSSFLVNTNKKSASSSTKKAINIQEEENVSAKKIESIEESKDASSLGAFGFQTPQK